MDTALLAFDVDGLHHGRLLRPVEAITWMQDLWCTLVNLASKSECASTCFTSQTTIRLHERRHAPLLLPISHDAVRARIDHVLVHAPAGFDAQAISALEQLRRIDRKGEEPLIVVLIDIGGVDQFRHTVGHFGSSKTWRNATPYVPLASQPLSDPQALERLIQEELASLGFPQAAMVEVQIGSGKFVPLTTVDAALLALTSAQLASQSSNPVELRPQLFLRLRFDQEVSGPLSLGFGFQLGMGQFVPI